MFFYLSKTLDALLSPLTWALLLFLLSLILSAKRRRAALICGLTGLLILLIFSSETVASVLWRAMESPAVTTMKPGVQYDAVIVLSGMVDDVATETNGQPSYNDNIERLLSAYQLLRDGRAKQVLLSGGSGRFDRSGPVEADVLAQQLQDWGVDKARIVEERLSRNTRENATESAKLVAQQGWSSLLAGDQRLSHAARARLFSCGGAKGRHAGGRLSHRRSLRAAGFPRAGALSASTAALRELAGRVVYRIVGFAR